MLNEQQSPLDSYMQQNSIFYKGTPGNIYNSGVDEYYIQREGYSTQYYNGNDGEQADDDCNACYNPNPPWWCSDPSNQCYDAAVPIEPGFFMLTLSFLFGIILIQKRFGFSKV